MANKKTETVEPAAGDRPQDDPDYKDAGQAFAEEANANQPAPADEPES